MTGNRHDSRWLRLPRPAARVLAYYRLFTGARLRRTETRTSSVTAYSRCQARHALGPRGVPAPLAVTRYRLLPVGWTNPSVLSDYSFRGSIPSRSAPPVAFTPRLLSCLRIDAPVIASPFNIRNAVLLAFPKSMKINTKLQRMDFGFTYQMSSRYRSRRKARYWARG
jgi:hypothetical protein